MSLNKPLQAMSTIRFLGRFEPVSILHTVILVKHKLSGAHLKAYDNQTTIHASFPDNANILTTVEVQNLSADIS
jgi:hypothetical protein